MNKGVQISGKFPTSSEILSNEGQKILDAIKSQEIKTDLEGREFSSQKEFYKAVNSMVSEAENISIKLGYGNLKDLENLGFNYRETMENFSDTLCKVLEKGTVINDNGTFSVKLDNHSLLRMTDYMKEKMSSLGKYSQKPIYDINYKDKEFEKSIKDTEYFQKTLIQNVNSSLDRLKDNLTLEVENSNLPEYFFEKKVVNSKSYFAKKMAFSAILCFMIYGWHSLLKNIPESMMDNARVAGINNSFAEFFVSTGIFAETFYWGLAGLIGASISYGLANVTSKSYYKMDKKRKLNNPKARKRDLLKNTGFALALTGAMTGAVVEGGGLLVNDIEDTYAQKIAKDNKDLITKKIGEIQKSSTNTLNEIISSTINNDQSRVSLEEGRGKKGPVSVAKSYLTEGGVVLNNDILKGKLEVMNIVVNTDKQVKEFYDKNKFFDESGKEIVFKTFPDFLNYFLEEQNRLLTELSKEGSGIYDKLGKNDDITHYLFHQETEKFEKILKENQEKLSKLKKQAEELQKIYGNFVTEIESKGNSMYGEQVVPVEFPELPNINLESSLADIIDKQPKLEGKTVLEYPSLYIDMWKEGYISSEDFARTSLSVAARSSLLELGVGILLILSLVHILNYRRAKGFSFEEQEKEISEYYDKLLDSIYKTFSGEHWKNIFPGHEGITKDEAEIILQRFLLEKEPSLKEWFFIEKKGADLSKNGKTLKTLNKILFGDFIGDREKFIDKLYKVFSEINDKAVSEGKVISSEDIEKIIYQVIPEKGSQKSSIVSNLFDKLRLKNFNENIGEIEIPREYLENISGENFKEYMHINVIENSKIYKTGDVYRLFSRYISSYENLGELKNLLDSYNGGISELDLMENIIKPKFLDFIDYDIEKLGEFQEELDKTLPEKVKVNDFLKAIEKSSGNKKIFLDKLLDVSKGEIFNFVSEIHITQENLSIMEKFLSEKFSYSEVQSFLYKLEPYIGKNITEEEFINLSKGILYDLDFNETIIKITQNLNEIYRLAFASRTKNFFVNPDNFKLEIKEISKEMISLGKKLEKMEDNPLTLELKKMFKDFEEGFKKLEFSSLNPFGNSKTLREFEEQKKLMEEYFLSIKSIFKKISENKSKLGKLADSTSKEGLEKLLSDIENISLKFDEDAEIVKEKFSKINSDLDSIKSSTEKTEVLDLETSKILKSIISLEGEIIKMDYLVSDNTKKALENLKKDFEKISLIDNLDDKEARIKSFSEEFEKYNKDLYEEVKNSLTAKIDEKINSLEGAGKSKYLEKFLKLKGRLIINQDTNFSNILNIKNDFEKYTETEKKFTENNRNKASIGKKFKGALKNVFKKSKPVSLEKQEIDDNSKKSPEIEYKPVEIEIPVEEINSEENNLKRFSLGKKLKKLFRKK